VLADRRLGEVKPRQLVFCKGHAKVFGVILALRSRRNNVKQDNSRVRVVNGVALLKSAEESG
jgi:hypothetical protein